MNDTQKWYESRTLWSSIIGVIAGLGTVFGLDIDAETQSQIVMGILAVTGSLAAFFRVRAERRIE